MPKDNNKLALSRHAERPELDAEEFRKFTGNLSQNTTLSD
jgi:hypothetical protein